MTHGEDAKHRAQEAAGEVWELGVIMDGAGPADRPPLYRCMGGRFCSHQPGTCTATWPVDKNATYSSKRPAPTPPSEREAIVAWLRGEGNKPAFHGVGVERFAYFVIADAIERGEHLKGDVA